MDNQLTEPQIVRGLQRGCPDAWAALCEAYSARVWAYLGRLIGSDESAVADVFQETMLAVAGSGRALRDRARLWAWLAAICHNQSALFWRRHYRQLALSGGETVTLTGVDDPVDDVLLQREQNAQVRRILAEMTAQDAVVLTAKYMDGLSVHEIVQLHGGTTESVRSRLARAKRLFRERFEREERGDVHREVVMDSDRPRHEHG